jgi:hypothetical protein
MAGILFTDGKFVLAGYSQHKSAITGIGGKAKNSETPTQTALRETLEELFEFEEIPETLTRLLNGVLVFDKMLTRSGYSVFVMTFDDLNLIFRTMMFVSNLNSKVYDVVPRNLNQLLMDRKVHPDAEFSHLLLLPYENGITIDKSLVNDIIHLKTMK